MFRKLFFFIFLLLNFGISAQKIEPFHGPFPEPAPNKHMMFYLQRTVDRNTVIYELNYEADGSLNEKRPLKIYWIDFDDGAKKTPLTFIQSKFAYGISAELIDARNKIFEIRLVSYQKIKFYLRPTGNNKHYQTHATIQGKPAILKRIFVNITGGTYLQPVVSSIELFGEELRTGVPLFEKIKPN